jgi:ATP-dependent helicase/nuclease subunit B
MSRLLLLPIGADVPEFLAELLARDFDPSAWPDLAVVFPHERPRLYLNRHLGERLKRPFFPPAYYSMDRFMLELARTDGATDTLDSLDAQALMLELLSAETEGDLGRVGHNPHLCFFWSRRLLDAIDELDAECVPDAAVRHITLEGPEVSRAAEAILSSLGRLRESFHAAVQETGRLTRGLAYAAAARSAGGHPGEALYAVLPPGLTRAEAAVIRRLERLDTVTFLTVGEVPERVRGVLTAPEPVPPTPAPEEIPAPAGDRLRLHAGFDAHSELLGLRHALSELTEEQLDRAVIVLPKTESLIPLLEEVLTALPPKYNISLGYPFVRTPVYALVRTVFALQKSARDGGHASRDYVNLLFHPYIKNLGDGIPPDACRALVHAVEERVLEAGSLHLSLQILEDDAGLFTDVSAQAGGVAPDDLRRALREIHRVFIHAFDALRTLGDLSRALLAAMRYLVAHCPAVQYPFSGEFFGTLAGFLDQLAGSRLAAHAPADRRSLFDFFAALAAQQRIPFRGQPLEGLQILGLLETRTLRFDRVFVLDVNEGTLPSVHTADPLLPLAVRQVLGLPGPKEHEAVTRHHLDHLMAGAAESHLFYVSAEEEAPSRFIARMVWEREQAECRLDCVPVRSVELRLEPPRPSAIAVPKDEAVLERLRRLRYSATALDAYLACPLRFYCQYVLGLRERDTLEDAVEGRSVGLVLHAAMERILQPRLGKVLDARAGEALQGGVVAAVDHAFQSRGWEKRGERFLVHQLLADRIRGFLEREAAEGWTPRQLEFELTARLAGLEFYGRIDRLDERPGSAGPCSRILDYKSGQAKAFLGKTRTRKVLEPFRSREELRQARAGSLQMPLYAWLAHEARGLDYDRMIVATVSLRYDEPATLFYNLEDPGRFMREVAVPTLEHLLAEILDPAIPFVADDSSSAVCRHCAFDSFCRR